MEGDRPLDLAGCSPGFALIRAVFFSFLCGFLAANAVAQTSSADDSSTTATKDAAQIVRELEALRARTAEQEFSYGSALARAGHSGEARDAFLRGRELAPGDKRFPQELAGIAFQQKDYKLAASWMRRAIALDPADEYANQFFATVYFLNNNLDAAVEYWNKAGKPEIAAVRTPTGLRVRPELLDRAFAFAPASELRLPDLETSRVRTNALGIFGNPRFDLAARDDGKFDVTLSGRERNGFGRTKWLALASTFRGVFSQTVNPEYYNVRGSAVNFISLLRWDVDKRRAMASLSGPWRRNPKYRYELLVDLRNENWDLYSSFRGPAPLLGALNMRTERGAVTFASFESGRWAWATGAELSHRDFRSVVPGLGLPAESLL